jgi:MSHA pilin protein MshA
MKNQAGFTLIELVIVIVILGILAATALPRFSDLTTDARISALQGLAGGVRSASAITHATQLAKSLTSDTDVSLEGTTVAMSFGYPEATAGGIGNALMDYTGFTLTGGQFQKSGAPDPTGCYVSYAPQTNGSFPVVQITSTGC